MNFNIKNGIILFSSFFLQSITFAEQNSVEKNYTNDSETICIQNGTKIFANNDRTINLVETFNHCVKAANQNNPLTWFFVGHMKLYGIGAQSDLSGGIEWIEKAANKGLAVAQKELSDYYLSGGGIDKKINVPEAMKWLKMLANGPSKPLVDDASFKLCALNLYGTKTKVDYEQALFWCKKSGLTLHNNEGLTNLAYMYINGLGVDKNVNLAIDYYTTAAKNGEIQAQLSLGKAYNLGIDVPQDYSKSLYWFNEAAEKNNPLAIYYIAQMYEYGQGVDIDSNKAFDLYLKSANLGDPQAQYKCGRLYQYTENPKLDLAAKWYHKAAKQSNVDAMLAIGDLYQNQNIKEMIYWYEQASQLGSTEAKNKLISIYVNGTKYNKPKFDRAFLLASELVDILDPNGYYWVGYMYYYGLHVEKDITKALSYLNFSAEYLMDKSLALLGKIFLENPSLDDQNHFNAKHFFTLAAEMNCTDSSCFELSKLYFNQIKNFSKSYLWLLITEKTDSNIDHNAEFKFMKSELLDKLSLSEQKQIETESTKWIEKNFK